MRIAPAIATAVLTAFVAVFVTACCCGVEQGQCPGPAPTFGAIQVIREQEAMKHQASTASALPAPPSAPTLAQVF